MGKALAASSPPPTNPSAPSSSQPPQPPPLLPLPSSATVLPPSDLLPPSFRSALKPKSPSPPPLSDLDLVKLRSSYPSRAKIPSDLISDGAKPWCHTLVGKFLGKNLSADIISFALSSKCPLQQEWEVISLNFRFFLLRFTCPSDRDLVLSGGPWVVDDATLVLELWTPSFVPSPSRLPRLILWMRLPNLPSVCWNEPCLRLIVASAGRFVKMDDSTSLLTKGRFARVAVEVDAANPLVPGSDVELEDVALPVFWQTFEYEHIHSYCPRCGRIGHRSLSCKFASDLASVPSSSSQDIVMGSVEGGNSSVVQPSLISADDDRPMPTAWIHVHHRRGQKTRQSVINGSNAGRRHRANSSGLSHRPRDPPAASTVHDLPLVAIDGPRVLNTESVLSKSPEAPSSVILLPYASLGPGCGPDLGSGPGIGPDSETGPGSSYFSPLGLLDSQDSGGTVGSWAENADKTVLSVGTELYEAQDITIELSSPTDLSLHQPSPASPLSRPDVEMELVLSTDICVSIPTPIRGHHASVRERSRSPTACERLLDAKEPQGYASHHQKVVAAKDDHLSRTRNLESPSSSVHAFVPRQSTSLRLKLDQTPAFKKNIEMKVDQARAEWEEKAEQYFQSLEKEEGNEKERENTIPSKTHNAASLTIGTWNVATKRDGDILAKFYFAKKKIIWEISSEDEKRMKNKIEISWDNVKVIKSIFEKGKPDILLIQLTKPPEFFHEVVKPKIHTQWAACKDFTDGHALSCRTHLVTFDEGTLEMDYNKLIYNEYQFYLLDQVPLSCLHTLDDMFQSQQVIPQQNPPQNLNHSSHETNGIPARLVMPMQVIYPSVVPQYMPPLQFQAMGGAGNNYPQSIRSISDSRENNHLWDQREWSMDELFEVMEDKEQGELDDGISSILQDVASEPQDSIAYPNSLFMQNGGPVEGVNSMNPNSIVASSTKQDGYTLGVQAVSVIVQSGKDTDSKIDGKSGAMLQ